MRWIQFSWVCAAAATLVACGGGDGNMAMRDWLSARPLSAPTTSPTLTAAETAEVADRSREWAVATLPAASLAPSNDAVVPPLYFSFIQPIARAAQGETLAELRAVHKALSSAKVEASLMRGVAREVRALPDTRFAFDFLTAIELPVTPAPWASFRATAVTDWASASEVTDTRMVIEDRFTSTAAWNGSAAFDGTFANATGYKQIVAMTRVSGAKRASAATFSAEGVQADGKRVIKITPQGGMAGFDVNAAIISATKLMADGAWGALADTTMVLPVVTVGDSARSVDVRGLARALDEVNADLRGLDGGGTYLRAEESRVSVDLSAKGMSWVSGQKTKFIFSVKNLFNPPYGSGSTRVDIGPIPPPACPSATPDLRPFYLLELDSLNRVVMLVRVAALVGNLCD